MRSKTEIGRLETPEAAGYKAGVPSSFAIGRRLGRLYDLPGDMPRRIGELLEELDRKIDRVS